MENQEAQVLDNPATPEAPVSATPEVIVTPKTVTGWQSNLRTDLKESPFVKKFEDNPDGLNKALESYGNLEKLLGHEKVPIPKDANDTEGWARFSKAMGIPEKPEGYGLKDGELPEALKGNGIDKGRFSQIMHQNKATPAQAASLWKTFNEMQVESYNKHVTALQENLDKTVNALKQEWGDAYQGNVELGQMVLNKFAVDETANQALTAMLLTDPHGIKFLASIGKQFAENKVGDFQTSRFALSPDEAQKEMDDLRKDINGPYMNHAGKFSENEHQAAVARMDQLLAAVNRAKG